MSKGNCESEARKKIAASIGATPEEIYFTSGRADGHLKALKAVVKASKKAHPHVIITTMEDPEVLDECSRLERKDAVVTYLDPITTGRVEEMYISLKILRMEKCTKSPRETSFQEEQQQESIILHTAHLILKKIMNIAKQTDIRSYQTELRQALTSGEKDLAALRLKALVEK